MSFQAPRGTEDLLPEETKVWRKVEEHFHSICSRYHYGEIRTPLFEQTELFIRGVGDSTDIVNKEMYTFLDRGGRSLTLRPEGTAGVVRAYVEHKLYGEGGGPAKFYYMGPMFRYERPQAGRQRQFHQFGVEAIGSHDPALDAEILSLAWNFLRGLGLSGIHLELNSVGCPICRPSYRKALVDYFTPHKGKLCEDCQNRLEKNPLRILDCKIDGEKELVKEAPVILDHLCEDCRTHFAEVKGMLDVLQIPYVINPRLVRGLDYYTRTAFEFMEGIEGNESTICGGGRYNGLVKEIGGPDEPGIGFGIGVERLILALRNQGIETGPEEDLAFYLIATGEGTKKEKARILQLLRQAGLSVETDYANRKMKGQLKAADRSHARFAVILGEEELAKGLFLLKDLRTGEQEAFPLAEMVTVCQQAVRKEGLPT